MTTAPVIDGRVHLAAIKALLNGPLDGRVYTYSEVPDTPPNIFAVVAVERRYVPPRPASGLSGRSGWRALIRFVGRTVNEAEWAALEVAQTLDEKRLAVGGETSTPVTHESTLAAAPDEDRFSGESRWTYAL